MLSLFLAFYLVLALVCFQLGWRGGRRDRRARAGFYLCVVVFVPLVLAFRWAQGGAEARLLAAGITPRPAITAPVGLAIGLERSSRSWVFGLTESGAAALAFYRDPARGATAIGVPPPRRWRTRRRPRPGPRARWPPTAGSEAREEAVSRGGARIAAPGRLTAGPSRPGRTPRARRARSAPPTPARSGRPRGPRVAAGTRGSRRAAPPSPACRAPDPAARSP